MSRFTLLLLYFQGRGYGIVRDSNVGKRSSEQPRKMLGARTRCCPPHDVTASNNVEWSRASVCLSVCLSAAACLHYFTDPDVTWRNGTGCPVVVHYWSDLQSVHVMRCYDNIARTRNVSECSVTLHICLHETVKFNVEKQNQRQNALFASLFCFISCI